MLRTGDDGVTFAPVGFVCGLSSLGRFARDYFQRLGQRPSDTIRFAQVRIH